MEALKITDFYFFPDPDISELYLQINSDKPLPATSELVNDEMGKRYAVYLRVEPDTDKIVGATIMYADNLFQELARAFANKDLNHPDVRFFLEKKLEAYARAHADELQPAPTPDASREREPATTAAE